MYTAVYSLFVMLHMGKMIHEIAIEQFNFKKTLRFISNTINYNKKSYCQNNINMLTNVGSMIIMLSYSRTLACVEGALFERKFVVYLEPASMLIIRFTPCTVCRLRNVRTDWQSWRKIATKIHWPCHFVFKTSVSHVLWCFRHQPSLSNVV